MKLLVVSQYYYPDPFRITDICESMVKKGHEVDVLTSIPNVPQGRYYDGYGWFKRGEKVHEGVKIERVGVFQRKKGTTIRLVLNCASFAINSLFHIPKLKRNNYDAVFVFNNSPITKILPAKRIARKNKIPNIVFLLDIWPQSLFFLTGQKEKDRKTLFQRIAYSFCVWLYKSVDLMLISSRGFDDILRSMGISCKMRYFPNYAEEFPLSSFKVNRDDFGIGEDDFVVGFAGNIGKAQGLEHTVEATKLSNIPSLKWLIVGDGPELDNLKSLVESNNLQDRYCFTGWVKGDKVYAYLSLSDALFLPLKNHEVLNLTVPAKLQTYMYAAKPVIAFMNGEGAELVKTSRCGVTASAEDTYDLTKALKNITELSKEELLEMGNNARTYCELNYSKDVLIDNLVQYISEAIEEYQVK